MSTERGFKTGQRRVHTSSPSSRRVDGTMKWLALEIRAQIEQAAA